MKYSLSIMATLVIASSAWAMSDVEVRSICSKEAIEEEITESELQAYMDECINYYVSENEVDEVDELVEEGISNETEITEENLTEDLEEIQPLAYDE